MKKFFKNKVELFSKYFGLDLAYFLKNSIYISTAHFFIILITLLTSMAFTRFVAKEIYGQWIFIFSIAAMLSIFALPGMNSSIIRSVAQGFEGALLNGTKSKFKWGFIGMIGLLMASIFFYFKDNYILTVGFLIVISYFYSNFVLESYAAYFQGKKNFFKSSQYRAMIILLTNIFTIIALYLTKDLLYTLLVFCLVHFLITLLIFMSTLRQVKNNNTNPQTIPYGKNLSLSIHLPDIILNYLDKIIIPYFVGFEQLAIYYIAIIIPENLRVFLRINISTILPKIVQMPKEKIYSSIRKKLYLSILIAILVNILVIIILPIIIKLVYTINYESSIFYAQIYSLALWTIVPGYILHFMLVAHKMEKEILYSRIIPAIIYVILLAFLTTFFQVIGVIIASLMFKLTNFICLWYLAKKKFS